MSQTTNPEYGPWTAVDLVEHFGPIPLHRVRQNPPPGTATEDDVVSLHDHEQRLCELVEGTLLEKTVGTYESWLAATLVRLLGNFVIENDLGVVLGADGMLRLQPGLVRIPDASFISWAKLPDRKVPRQPIADLVPDLAVEVISQGNTQQEMDRKLDEYFQSGVSLVWYVYPETKTVHSYSGPSNITLITQNETVLGGDVLPGFSLRLNDWFE